jgi:muramoyltetrapeptide carboxypeptidase
MIKPPHLVKGDLIYITAPAKYADESSVFYAKNLLEKAGFRVLLSKHCLGKNNYLSGLDAERLSDLQFGIDHPEVRAIICARGGYGCVRIVDQVNWANMLLEPKWLVGFSDITVFHHRLIKLGVQCIHGTMPLNFETNTAAAIDTLLHNLSNTPADFNLDTNNFNKQGVGTGMLMGGNLSIVHSMLGTDDQYNFEDAILFIEDVGEHLYQIDRMIFALKKSGALHKIKGLIVGGMSDLEDTDPPFGQSITAIINSQFEYSKIPVLFGFPAGHISDNRSLVFGKRVSLEVGKEKSHLHYLN